MKPYVAVKRRWKWFATAVPALVLFSLLVPLVFLLGLHNQFPSGYISDDSSSSDAQESGFEGYDKLPTANEKNLSAPQGAELVDDIVRKLHTGFSKDTESSGFQDGIENGARSHYDIKEGTQSNSQVKDEHFHRKGIPSTHAVLSKSLDASSDARNDRLEGTVSGMASVNHSVGDDEIKKLCELEYGSYCLWSFEHKVELKDFLVKKLKDQLFVARAYFPSIAKIRSEDKFSREVKQNIQDHERMISEAIVDADLPKSVQENVQKMEETITKAKSFNVECTNVYKKLAQILDLTEDEAQFHTRQGSFLYHLGAQTMPKSLHCLSMRLTVEYFRNPSAYTEMQHEERHENPVIQHYVVFSKNVLASSVIVNSTVMNAKVSKNLVFHLLTDEQHYYTMKFWFSQNSYKDAVVHVLNMESLDFKSLGNFNLPHMSFSEEFRISILDPGHPSSGQIRTEYMSIFGHSHFLLPDIFKNLKRVIILDDDVVVQKDLSPLWSLDLKGKVNGAVQLCKVRLGHLKHYLGRQRINNDSCAWTSGLNIVDLEKWREHDITATYQMLHKEVLNMNVQSWRATSLPISLLAFQDHIYPLNDTWVLSGLGKDYRVNKDTISKAGVLHYNGNMKPWLDFGIPKYKSYWINFLARGDQYMDDCNVIF